MTTDSIESRSSWQIAAVSVVLLATSFGALWISAVGLTAIAADLGGARSTPSLANSLGWLGTAVGGVLMGRIAERYGIRWTVLIGAVSIAVGLFVATRGEAWQLYVGHGLFIGILGNGGLNAPLYVYISHWFERRRGSALALISSAPYLAGAVWPPIFERAIAHIGWQSTMLLYALFQLAVILPLGAIWLRPPPTPVALHGGAAGDGKTPTVFGWPPNLVYAMLASAAFLCCVTMSMPQAHLVALCTDLGISASHGAAMLSLLLTAGFFSRQAWGAIADRIGGLLTLLLSSSLQALAMSAFIVTQDEAGLFAVAGAFGIGFSALIPAYVLAVREYYPAREASWRVPTLLLMSGTGMAAGTWLAGAMYDYFGFYAPAFAAGVGFNLVNLALIATLVLRRRHVDGRRSLTPA
ncbi:MAG: MFS transporter [Hyphomicrobiales bacterium]|nr:MFS transporter [Hyphomicrobiales bacterium]